MAMALDDKLRSLAEAASLGSMRAAGEKLDVAVSSISRQISQLEAQIGMALLEKGRRTIKLTEAGELAVRYYRESTASREALESSLQALRGLRAGRVQLAVGEGFVSAIAAPLLKLMSEYPGVQLSVNVAPTLDLMRQIEEDEAHIGLVFHAPADPNIRVRCTVPQPIKLIVHPTHPLANAPDVRLEQIVRDRLCMTESGFRIRQIIAMAEAHERVSLLPAVTTNSLSLLRQMVESGDFVTILPELAVIGALNERKLVSVPIKNAALMTTSINLVCRLGRTLPRVAAAFLPVLERAIHSLSKPSPLGAGLAGEAAIGVSSARIS